MYTLNDIEKKQNIKFPEEYKRLYQSDFKEFSNRLEIICLYYRENRENPSIIYWNYELAIENSAEGLTFLFSSLHEFITNTIKL